MRASFRLFLAVCAAGVVGCGGPSPPKTYPATGRVQFDGRPLERALVVFHARTPNAAVPRPRAQSGADGTFAVQTFAEGDGLPEGDYDVTIECWRSPGGEAPPVNRLPTRYASTQTSGLRVAVRADANADANAFPTFELKR